MYATHSINYALKGLLKLGDKVISTSIEHNSVMRPLRSLEQERAFINIISCNEDSSMNLHYLEEILDTKTNFLIIDHASNVTATIKPIKAISSIASKLRLYRPEQTSGSNT